MHPDLPRLLDLQTRDLHLASLTAQRRVLHTERAGLEAILDRVRNEIANAQRMADDFGQRRDALAKKLEAQRAQQEKRREKLNGETNPRVATQLMADLEMARGILAQEESDWMRLAEDTDARTRAVADVESKLAALTAEQTPARADLEGRLAQLESEITSAQIDREGVAAHVERTLRTRYDRLRATRKAAIIVEVERGTCTSCYTSIPSSQLGPLQADGVLFQGCQMCGAILYVKRGEV